MRDEVYDMLISELKEDILKKSLAGEDASNAKQVKTIIDRTFTKMQEMFEPRQEVKQINQAK